VKILVSGASGFLGGHLFPALKAAGHEVDWVSHVQFEFWNNDQNIIGCEQYDRIYHLAAHTQAGDWAKTHKTEQWLINNRINNAMLDFWSHQDHAKLIMMGTSCTYDPDYPLHEDYFFTGHPIDDLYSYAWTKRAMFIGAEIIGQEKGLPYLGIVPSTIYGSNYQYRENHQPHFIFDLLRKIYNGKNHNAKVVLWGDGYQKRDLVHVKDVVSQMMMLDEKGLYGTLVNIGAGYELSIREYAALLSQEIGYDASEIKYDEKAFVGVQSKCLNISRLRGLLPDYNPVPIEKGIREIVADYEKRFGG
jgi:GDP-L-fucose synthase